MSLTDAEILNGLKEMAGVEEWQIKQMDMAGGAEFGLELALSMIEDVVIRGAIANPGAAFDELIETARHAKSELVRSLTGRSLATIAGKSTDYEDRGLEALKEIIRTDKSEQVRQALLKTLPRELRGRTDIGELLAEAMGSKDQKTVEAAGSAIIGHYTSVADTPDAWDRKLSQIYREAAEANAIPESEITGNIAEVSRILKEQWEDNGDIFDAFRKNTLNSRRPR